MANTGGTSLDMREVQRNFRRLAKRAPEVADRAAELASEAFISEAQTRAPVKTGFLKDSDFNEQRGRRRVFGFGAVYAAAVHEKHTTHALYLLGAIRDTASKIIPAAFRKALQEKGGLKR
ncbi:MAG: HK97 gp10 family phage protein [Planctomycetes bacterium]|nr:HK97 gp10 family phage protein [Planctomycetota bacterium]